MILSFLVAALAAFALAAPKPLQKRSFHVAARGRNLSPQQEFLRAYRKYGWEIMQDAPDSPDAPTTTVVNTVYVTAPAATSATSVPSGVYGTNITSTSNAVASATAAPTKGGGDDGEVEATPEDNASEYLSPVTVGGQKLNLNFDTGSADLWVFSTSLSSQDIGDHSVFNPGNSLKWKSYPGASWDISYGDGSGASGNVGFDTVDVGGSTVQSQCVEIATEVSEQFVNDENSDGLLGLAFSSLSTVKPQQQKTFFENVMDDLTQPLFTADLEDSSGKASYEFGFIDSSKHSGQIHYTDVNNSAGWWQFDSPMYAVNGNQAACTFCNPMIADTGTSLIYMDSDIVSAFYKSCASAQQTQYGWAHSCDETLPSLGIAIGENLITIEGADMTYASLDDGSGYCMGGLQAGPGQFQILGGVALKKLFAVFDGGNMRFGVAAQ